MTANRNFVVCFPTKDMQTPPLLLRSGHFDIKNAQCAKKMMGVKLYIISRLDAAGVQKGFFEETENSTFFKNDQISRVELIRRSFFA